MLPSDPTCASSIPRVFVLMTGSSLIVRERHFAAWLGVPWIPNYNICGIQCAFLHRTVLQKVCGREWQEYSRIEKWATWAMKPPMTRKKRISSKNPLSSISLKRWAPNGAHSGWISKKTEPVLPLMPSKLPRSNFTRNLSSSAYFWRVQQNQIIKTLVVHIIKWTQFISKATLRDFSK